ncbi:hypothetical protein ACFY12_15540 [Streptomyces sp. NPDC001339]|nr:hypothetical protein [Streptomyces sp. NBRC 110611]GAU67753.1 Syd protein [Streptomyces sp. NBRC 110611]
MYSIEMAYARMRELQDQANRSRAHKLAQPQSRRRFGRATTAKKR